MKIYVEKREKNGNRFFIMAEMTDNEIKFSVESRFLDGPRWHSGRDIDLETPEDTPKSIIREIQVRNSWAAPMSPELQSFLVPLWEAAGKDYKIDLSTYPTLSSPLYDLAHGK